MSTTLPAFTPIEETLYLTLCGRAMDNHLPDPILADPRSSSPASGCSPRAPTPTASGPT